MTCSGDDSVMIYRHVQLVSGKRHMLQATGFSDPGTKVHLYSRDDGQANLLINSDKNLLPEEKGSMKAEFTVPDNGKPIHSCTIGFLSMYATHRKKRSFTIEQVTVGPVEEEKAVAFRS